MTIDRWNPQAPFPIPRRASMLSDFMEKLSTATGAPHSLTAPVVTSVASAAVACCLDVVAPYGATIGTGLSCAIVSGTSTGKSTVLRMATSTLEEFEAGLLEPEEQPIATSSPTRPSHHQFMLSDASEGGVMELYESGAMTVFHALDEGAKFFQRLDIPALCSRLDGGTLRRTRKAEAPLILHDRRAAMCLMIQDVPFQRLLEKKGDLLVDSGLLNRTMLSFVESQGLLGADQCNATIDEQTIRSHIFHTFVRAHMSMYARALRRPRFHRWKLTFETPARDSWHEFVRDLDRNVQRDAPFAELRPFVARAGEHCVKLAAVLQQSECPQPTIQRWAVDCARDIVAWHLMEAKAVFGSVPVEVRIQRNANELQRYLNDRAVRTGHLGISRSDLIRFGPKQLRNADSLDMALHCLQQFGHIGIGSQRGKSVVYVRMPTWADNMYRLTGLRSR